jgi:HTH-type transcriptional regulator, transcriptional repressor of NAD biosynthesis genes
VTDPTGLIVGRFCPPHLGHSHLIEQAGRTVDRLVVMVNTREGEPVPGELRAGWLAELHPDVVVVEVRHDLPTDFDDQELWARWMALFREHWPLTEGPHVVFSSEPYGDEIARRFGARAVAVDPARTAVPVSATLIRERPLEHLQYLAPPVRAWMEAQVAEGPKSQGCGTMRM